MNLTKLRQLANRLDYAIKCNVVDFLQRKWKYKTCPSKGGGSTNYFDSLESIEVYLKRCEQIRSWQTDTQE